MASVRFLITSLLPKSLTASRRVESVALLSLLLVVALTSVCRAQEKSDTPAVDPKEVQETQKLLDTCDDIDKLNILVPLKFTAGQLDTIILSITGQEKDYARDLLKLNAGTLQPMAEAIQEQKKRSLAGSPVSADFAARMSELLRKREKLNGDTVNKVTQRVEKALTSEQKALIASMVKKAETNAGRNGNLKEPQLLKLYMLNLLSYPRIVPLLKDLRASLVVSGSEKTEDTSQKQGNGNRK